MASTDRKKTTKKVNSKSGSAGRNTSASGKRNTKAAGNKNTASSGNRNPSGSGKSDYSRQAVTERSGVRSSAMNRDIHILVVMAIALLLFLSLLGLCGGVGRILSGFLFGLFGTPAYVFPFLLVYVDLFLLANDGVFAQLLQRICGLAGIYVFVCAFFQLILYGYESGMTYMQFYRESSVEHNGGGLIGGSIVSFFGNALGTIGAYVIILIALVIFAILLTQKPLLSVLRKQSERAYDSAQIKRQRRADASRMRRQQRRQQKETDRAIRDRQKAVQAEREANVAAVRARTGNVTHMVVPQNLKEEARLREEVKRLGTVHGSDPVKEKAYDIPDDIIVNTSVPVNRSENFTFVERPKKQERVSRTVEEKEITEEKTEFPEPSRAPEPVKRKRKPSVGGAEEIRVPENDDTEEYVFPPTSLLKSPGKGQAGDSNDHLKATAAKLQKTLHDFGVEVTINHISCGPTVTRYELTPQQGVKVSKILSLSDDIKLNLAAADIRIEAPIPGKSAIGIEVPNKTNTAVLLRELLESQAFRRHRSPLAFAVGKDIAGQPVITDIGKMPHLLIAGATGSGKSVCINTLIMSILYKSPPEEVKFIMIDPKVVELSVYNGIPHLFIPVVTDPKKAAGALNWAVSEMTERYQKFAEYGVRDLAGYNSRVETMPEPEEGERPKKMPRLIIIVDELADLMMVAQSEVEDSICRLAQLARAAGIHLIIATQRPSVNVITGLIKANMPSRVALSVTSGVDSRTILDMNGAEKLLGHGDMLFYPQGYQKPARVQGAYVSDDEILQVVHFLLQHHKSGKYDEEIQKKIEQSHVSESAPGSGDVSGQDEYFTDAGKLIIEKDKASIGMLQRAFRIGFNRAARIMDQLCDAGVVGEEEGTKPRKVLMSMEQFENYLEEN